MRQGSCGSWKAQRFLAHFLYLFLLLPSKWNELYLLNQETQLNTAIKNGLTQAPSLYSVKNGWCFKALQRMEIQFQDLEAYLSSSYRKEAEIFQGPLQNFCVKSKHLPLSSWCFNIMLLKEQTLPTELQRETPFILLTSLISYEIPNINTIRIILAGCLIPGSIEINVSSLLPSKVAIKFTGKDIWNLHCMCLYCIVQA